MERGHVGSEVGHCFLHVFPAGKEYIDFSAYPTLSLSDLLYSYFHTTTGNTIPCISRHQVPACQPLAENIYLSGNLWISWVNFWADPLSVRWTLMGSLLSHSSLYSQPLPLLSHEPTPWISKVIEGILRTGNAELRLDAVIAPIRASTAEGHSGLQPGPPCVPPCTFEVCSFHPNILPAFAHTQKRSVEFSPVGILISDSKTTLVLFRATRKVSQTLQSIYFLSWQKLLKHYLVFTFIMTFFLVSHLPPLDNLFDALFHPPKPWHNIAQQHKDTVRMVSLQEAVFQDHMSALLPDMWFPLVSVQALWPSDCSPWLTSSPPIWGGSGGFTLQFCLVCWDCRIISLIFLLIRMNWFSTIFCCSSTVKNIILW